MQALTGAQRVRHRELALQLRPLVRRYIELEDGYAAELSASVELAPVIEEFVTLELLCCPFFMMVLESDRQIAMLNITGRGDIKPFIRQEFAIGKEQIVSASSSRGGRTMSENRHPGEA